MGQIASGGTPMSQVAESSRGSELTNRQRWQLRVFWVVLIFVLVIVWMTAGSLESGPTSVHTLYRGSTTDSAMRIPVATFDTSKNADFNRENCEVVKGLFSNQPGVVVRYWCEAGRFKR